MESWRSYLNEEQEQLDEGWKQKLAAGLAALGIITSPAQAQSKSEKEEAAKVTVTAHKALSRPMFLAVQQIASMKPGQEIIAPKGVDADTLGALYKIIRSGKPIDFETLVALDKRTRLEDPFNKPFGEEETISVDFDDTLKMTDSGTANPIVVNKIKQEIRPVHIVTSRKDTPENRKEIEDFVKENELNIKDIHFTNLDRKSELLKSINSIKHYDNDSREWKNIENNAPETEIVKIDSETGKITDK